MSIIPKELQQAVRASQGRPIRRTDPETHAEYVLLQAEVYDQIQSLCYDDTLLTHDEKRSLLILAGYAYPRRSAMFQISSQGERNDGI